MSARLPRLAWGMALTTVALALCLLSVTPAQPNQETRFLSGGHAPALEEIQLPRGTVPVNTGDLYDLLDLPGVGETIAGAILSERELNGRFYYPEDLLRVKGIGEKKLEGLRDWLDLSE